MGKFNLIAEFKPTLDQKNAAKEIIAGFVSGQKFQTLLGVTGSGKTFTMAQVIAETGKPSLVISHNKAWQLYQEFKNFFPDNEVHYFVSYYDYYQPEAYLPSTDTYIEKDASINETIDKLRHAATQAVLTRPDTIIISSVSCIYNLGNPQIYKDVSLLIKKGQAMGRQKFLRSLIELRFTRNDMAMLPGTFSAKGEIVTIYLPTGEKNIRIVFSGNKISQIKDSQAGGVSEYFLFPAKHFLTRQDKMDLAIENIKKELVWRLKELKKEKKIC